MVNHADGSQTVGEKPASKVKASTKEVVETPTRSASPNYKTRRKEESLY